MHVYISRGYFLLLPGLCSTELIFVPTTWYKSRPLPRTFRAHYLVLIPSITWYFSRPPPGTYRAHPLLPILSITWYFSRPFNDQTQLHVTILHEVIDVNVHSQTIAVRFDICNATSTTHQHTGIVTFFTSMHRDSNVTHNMNIICLKQSGESWMSSLFLWKNRMGNILKSTWRHSVKHSAD